MEPVYRASLYAATSSSNWRISKSPLQATHDAKVCCQSCERTLGSEIMLGGARIIERFHHLLIQEGDAFDTGISFTQQLAVAACAILGPHLNPQAAGVGARDLRCFGWCPPVGGESTCVRCTYHRSHRPFSACLRQLSMACASVAIASCLTD
jgi:hypothetical protein